MEFMQIQCIGHGYKQYKLRISQENRENDGGSGGSSAVQELFHSP